MQVYFFRIIIILNFTRNFRSLRCVWWRHARNCWCPPPNHKNSLPKWTTLAATLGIITRNQYIVAPKRREPKLAQINKTYVNYLFFININIFSVPFFSRLVLFPLSRRVLVLSWSCLSLEQWSIVYSATTATDVFCYERWTDIPVCFSVLLFHRCLHLQKLIFLFPICVIFLKWQHIL